MLIVDLFVVGEVVAFRVECVVELFEGVVVFAEGVVEKAVVGLIGHVLVEKAVFVLLVVIVGGLLFILIIVVVVGVVVIVATVLAGT